MRAALATERFAGRARFLGLFAAMLALAGQIALGAVVLRTGAEGGAARLAAVAQICGPGQGGGKPLPHHPRGTALIALAQAVAQSAGLLGPASVSLRAPLPPAPPALRVLPAAPPPAALRLAAQPRAPPALA